MPRMPKRARANSGNAKGIHKKKVVEAEAPIEDEVDDSVEEEVSDSEDGSEEEVSDEEEENDDEEEEEVSDDEEVSEDEEDASDEDLNENAGQKQSLDDLMDDDDDDELLPVEQESRRIEEEDMQIDREADEEMDRIVKEDKARFFLPERTDEDEGIMPPGVLKERIQDIIEVLSDFKDRRQPGRARTDYVEQLALDLTEYYGYLRELTDLFLGILSPAECVEFMEASESPRPLVIRTNTLKTRRKDLAEALIKRGVQLEPLASWSKVGLKILESSVPIGATPEYLSGHYMIQAASSMCPVMALDPQPGERVLDMSAAPGGKTSYVAQLMKNQGSIIANDLKKERQKSTTANLQRLGVRNSIVCCHNGKAFPQVMGGFDRVLLDAPCSGLGIASRDQSVKIQRTVKDVEKMAHLQKELLLAAIDSVSATSKNGGGVVVYSTCSVTVHENELVVDYALKRRCVRLLQTGLEHGRQGLTRFNRHRFDPAMALTRRFYPHVHNMDGFFVAKFQKYADGPRGGDGGGSDDDDDISSKTKRKQERRNRARAAEAAEAVDAVVVEAGDDDAVVEEEAIDEEKLEKIQGSQKSFQKSKGGRGKKHEKSSSAQDISAKRRKTEDLTGRTEKDRSEKKKTEKKTTGDRSNEEENASGKAKSGSVKAKSEKKTVKKLEKKTTEDRSNEDEIASGKAKSGSVKSKSEKKKTVKKTVEDRSNEDEIASGKAKSGSVKSKSVKKKTKEEPATESTDGQKRIKKKKKSKPKMKVLS